MNEEECRKIMREADKEIALLILRIVLVSVGIIIMTAVLFYRIGGNGCAG